MVSIRSSNKEKVDKNSGSKNSKTPAIPVIVPTVARMPSQDLEVLYFENNKIIRSRMVDVLKKYKIDGLIRFQEEDFKYIKSKSWLTHFNIPYSVGRRGKVYGLVKIVDYGSYDLNNMRMPVLDFNKMYKAVCLKTRNNVKYSELKNEDFKHSLKNIKSVAGLKKAMIRRYNNIMPSLTNDQIIGLGLSIRELQVL
ncbi:MAG TPA: hypothetical protein V6C58_11280 [Allocoleopsis sp.]